MLVLIVKRIGTLIITLLVTSFLVFGSLYLAPGDPISFLIQGRSPSPEAIAQVTAEYGLDKPFIVQYVDWLGNLLHGDFGRSFQFKVDVSTLIDSRLPTTMGLLVYAGLIILIVGLVSGIASALTNGRRLDRSIQVSLSTFAAIPSFVAAIVLIAIFAVQLHWFPVFGAGTGFVDTVYHLTLPSIALAVSFIALVGRITRSSVLDQLTREHVEVATSRGMSGPSVIRRHVLRNSVGPILTVSGLLVAGLLVSSAIVEQSFGLSGIGSLLVQSVNHMDFPVVQAIVLIVVFAFVVVNTVVALLTPLIDPRAASGEAAR